MSRTTPLDQPVDAEILALRDLVERDEFVGLVRLLDRAGTADDGRDAGLLEEPAFGAEADLARAVGAGEGDGELHHLVVDAACRGRGRREAPRRRCRLAADRLHLGQERSRRSARSSPIDALGIVARQMANLEIEAAFACGTMLSAVPPAMRPVWIVV